MPDKTPCLAFFPNHNSMCTDIAINAWTGCPFLEVHFISPYFIRSKYSHILEYIISSIQEDFYIYTYLNRSFLNIGKIGNHKTFIYGFAKTKKEYIWQIIIIIVNMH